MSVNVAPAARVGAYALACLIAVAMALAANGRAVPAKATWRDALQRAEAALAGGDVLGAQQAWQEAYRAVMGARSPEGMLDVGRAYLRIGEAARDRGAAVAQARRIYLVALFRARERRDADAVAHAGQAFAALGDREVAERAFEVAMALATQNRDAAARDRIAALRARADYTTRTP
jgi:tetratricopeptide (TPR) repeat protein